MKIQPFAAFSRFAALGALLLGIGLAVVGVRPLEAQSPAANALTVKLLVPIDSAQAAAGQRFHAAIAKDTAIGGVFLAKGADATITLVPGTGGNRWTLNLIEVTVNGKVVGVLGQNPAVVPTSAGDFLTMSKKTVNTKDRLAVAAGENIRFILGPAPAQTPAQKPGGVAANQTAAPPALSAPAAGQDRTAFYASQPVAGPKPGQYAHIGPFGSVLYDKDANIEVRLDHCDRQATATSSCDVSVMNRGKPIQLGPSTGGFAIIDAKGQSIGLQEAKCCGGRNFGTYLAGVETHTHYRYDGLDPDVKSLARVSVKFFFTGSGRYSEFEFRNVPLGQVAQQAFTPTPLEPATSVVEEQGWRISLARCSPILVAQFPDGQGIQCFFKVENMKADRGLELHGPSFVDPEGRTFDSSWYYYSYTTGFIGDSATYAHTSAVPYLNPDVRYGLNQKMPAPDIKYGEPRYIWAAFSGVPKDVKHIVQLDYGFSWGPNTWLQGTFRDIDLTPMPKAAPTAAAKKTK